MGIELPVTLGDRLPRLLMVWLLGLVPGGLGEGGNGALEAVRGEGGCEPAVQGGPERRLGEVDVARVATCSASAYSSGERHR
ncbi:hypothetical protein FH609_030550 [Streptomyces sp. 3MP-14]|uniref:Uncharacterized protein n=1 Tax=Streptomyces mimosae TaxID=2586635 RepID=A0A5N5ZLR8_9ACTN|nr:MULTISPECIES: hypothetical protein [Streptomyces]KAB8157454.1 hypothetical protein FH607_030340 [Streptomyces mimosae]KAB8172278.1 hypothetical protein FH609_030550 [Streptomyces sp. 3MP-14]